MAALSEILSVQFPGAQWSLPNHADKAAAYATLVWSDPVIVKPTLADLLALDAATDTELATRARKGRQADELLKGFDALLVAFDVIGDALAELVQKVQLKPLQTLNPAIVTRVQNLLQRIADAKAVT